MNERIVNDIYAVMNERLVPYGVALELTARCNLDCRHCYHVTADRPELTHDELCRLMDDLAALGTFELTLTGGEPLLREDFLPILQYAVEKAGFSVKIFSNLTLVDEAYADGIASVPLRMVETTLLGADAATHDALVSFPGAFDRLRRAVALLRDRGVTVGMKTLVMTANAASLDAMYRLADEWGVPFRHDDALFVEADGGRRPLALGLDDTELKRLRRRYGDTLEDSYGICNAARSVLSIAPDGTVYPCGAFPVAAGSVRDEAIGRIWRESPLFQRLRELEDTGYDLCAGCMYALRCRGCVAMGMGTSAGRIESCRLARKHLRRFM